MKRIVLAALLPIACGTAGCGIDARVESAGHDPAVLASCPRSVERPGDLPPRAPFTLPDGRTVVPIEQADARENMLTAGALVFRGAWLECRSVVEYVEQVDAGLAR